MGAGRREREKQELRRAILDSARQIAIQEGWEAVTIRKIASAIEYGPPAIYALFENKDAILTELIQDGFQHLLEVLRAAQKEVTDPEARLLKLGETYWNFSEAKPRLYKVMYGLDGVPFELKYKPPEIKELNAFVGDALRDAIPNKQFTQSEIDDMVQILRATFQGFIALAMAGRIEGGRPRAKALMERALHDLLNSWKNT